MSQVKDVDDYMRENPEIFQQDNNQPTIKPVSDTSLKTHTWGTENSWLATTDDPAGFYKAGDQIVGSYDNNKNLIGTDVYRKDGSQGQLSYSADRSKAYYTEWVTEQGVEAKATQMEFDVGADGTLTRAASPFLYKGYQYDANGNPVPVAGHTAPSTVNPALPSSATPTAEQAQTNAINGLDLDSYGIDPSDVTLPNDWANTYMPSGNASAVIASLRAQGYTVSADDDGIFAQKGDAYLFVGDGYMQVGDGTNIGTVEVRGTELVVSKALITSDTESTRSTQTFTLQGVLTSANIEVTNGDNTETSYQNAQGQTIKVVAQSHDEDGDVTTQQTTKTNPLTNQTSQTVLVQTDDDGNTLITTTNANGSGTMQVLDSEGNVIGQASFQRTHNGAGTMDGEAGTVTAVVGGNNVTYSAAFDDDFGLVSFDGSGGTGEDERDTSTTLGQVSLLGVQAIGGQAVNYSPVNASMAAADLDLADLWAYGGYSTNTDGTTSATPTLQASHELQQATATANPNLTGQSQLVAPPVAVAGHPSVLEQLNSWAHDHSDFAQGLNGTMTLLRGLQTNNKISITTRDADKPHGGWLAGHDALDAANDVVWRTAA